MCRKYSISTNFYLHAISSVLNLSHTMICFKSIMNQYHYDICIKIWPVCWHITVVGDTWGAYTLSIFDAVEYFYVTIFFYIFERTRQNVYTISFYHLICKMNSTHNARVNTYLASWALLLLLINLEYLLTFKNKKKGFQFMSIYMLSRTNFCVFGYWVFNLN